MSAMFQNAVAAIRMGIEDYALDRPDRSLSAVRNFYAGVLLLAKEALVRHAPLADPDAVIGARYKPVPDGAGGSTMSLIARLPSISRQSESVSRILVWKSTARR